MRTAPIRRVPAFLFPLAHVVVAFAFFSLALFYSWKLHYLKVVKNHVATYPDEWMPSLSAVCGDWAPERNIVMYGAAVAATPRLVTMLFWHLSVARYPEVFKRNVFASLLSFLRTLALGGFLFITSTDNMAVHVGSTVAFLVFSLIYQVVMNHTLAAAARAEKANLQGLPHAKSGGDPLAPRSMRIKLMCTLCEWATVGFAAWFFYQHLGLEIPGAYSKYALCEWMMVLFDVGYDATHIWDFQHHWIGMGSEDQKKRE